MEARAAQGTQERPEEIQERPAEGTERDWQIAREQLSWALEQRLDTLPRFGDALARIGERFIDAPYEPHTLELSGPERLVINLETLDCVTFVENVLVLARLAWVRAAGGDRTTWTASRPPIGASSRASATGAACSTATPAASTTSASGSPTTRRWGWWTASRRSWGGVVDPSPVDFMSTHPDAYRQLAEPVVLEAIADMETRLRPVTRHYIPASRHPRPGTPHPGRGHHRGDQHRARPRHRAHRHRRLARRRAAPPARSPGRLPCAAQRRLARRANPGASTARTGSWSRGRWPRPASPMLRLPSLQRTTVPAPSKRRCRSSASTARTRCPSPAAPT